MSAVVQPMTGRAAVASPARAARPLVCWFEDCCKDSVPLVGGRSVTIMRISVDFPAPFGPSRPKISPSLTSKLMPLTAVKSPNFLTIS